MSDHSSPKVTWTFLELDEVGSTNDVVLSMLVSEATKLPLVVVARRQLTGRGQQTRTWWSDEGSLTFSLGLDPNHFGLRRDQVPRVSLATAVGLIDVLESSGVPTGAIRIRWPNDLEAGSRKLAGILPEWVDSPRGGRLVLGVGLNVTSDLEAAPEDVRRLATTLAAIPGATLLEKDALLLDFLKRIEEILRALGREDPDLALRWSALDSLKGTLVRVEVAGRIVAGRGAGINEYGGLRLDVSPSSKENPEPVVLYAGRVLR